MADSRTETAEALARRLATPEGLREARLQQAAGALKLPASGAADVSAQTARLEHASDVSAETSRHERGAPGVSAETSRDGADIPAGSAAAARPIGIWQPEGRGSQTVWVRPAPQPLGDHYAATRELRPKRPDGPRRVAFFGESAAAGYLYAPHLTPARVLDAQLAALDGPGGWEVIDLARTNERLATLAATVEAAMQLQPDLLVVYAGNNWTLLETPELSPFAPSVTARQRLAAALREGGDGPRAMAEAAARLARRELAQRAAAALERVGRAAAGAGIPVVVVLPEVNLADWETRQPPALLFGDEAARWHAHLARALAALGEDDLRTVEEAAWAMVELDGGFCPTPFRLLAEAARRDGRDADARDAAISEVDALHYPLMAFLAAPRAGTAERRILAAEAERRGWGAVDLRQVFADATGDPLPGRHLFLDYCHLTREGMKIAMAAVAVEVLRRTGTDEADPDALRRRAAALPEPEIAPEAEAAAFLGAAVHTAHRHLPVTDRGDLLAHWCRRALAASPGVAAAMLDLADARTAPLPEALTAAQQRNLASPHPLTLQHGWRWEGADADLLAAMREALAGAGCPEAAALDRLLAARRSVRRPGADLLAEPLARPFPEAMAPAGLAPRATLRCLWPEVAVDPGRESGAVEVVARLATPAGEANGGSEGCDQGAAPGERPEEPSGPQSGRAAEKPEVGEVLALRGDASSERYPVGPRWRRLRVTAPGERLTLHWPTPHGAAAEALRARAVRDLEEGREALLHQLFGELFSVRPADC